MNVLETHIISGQWKGRKLRLPDDANVRPSKLMVRQAVFNLLGSRLDWEGLSVVDLCCGSAAWGLEAASRGAAQVVCVDVNVATAQWNWESMGRPGDVELVKADVRTWTPAARLSVVLADPPYGQGIAQDLLARRKELGSAGSWWVVETATGEELVTDGFAEVVQRTYGQSTLWVLRQT